MHSELFHIGSLPIRAYGVALAISFLAGIIVAMYRARRFGISPNYVIDLSLVILIAAIIGSRFFYVVFHLEEFRDNYWDILNPFQSSGNIGIAGLSMMGGVVLVIISAILFIRWRKMPLWESLDTFAPSFLLGLAITRIGCLLNGCCFGEPTDWFWGIEFPRDCAAGWHYPGQHLHPAQLISSFAGFLMFGLLLWLERKASFRGFTFVMMVIFYAAFRFVIDFFRYYEPSMVFVSIGGADFSNNQALSVLMLVIFVSMYFILSKRKQKPNHAIPDNNIS
ncbi:MAG: prolipoprotein diacylglyceryl transferase [candidate division Zixibacteria bacterium]|nr:prolipoprotein diacylglyceryl transferase [candidate division Zixibacteria bacterium]